MYLNKDKIKKIIRCPVTIITIVILLTILIINSIHEKQQDRWVDEVITDGSDTPEEAGPILYIQEMKSDEEDYAIYSAEYRNKNIGVQVRYEERQLDKEWKSEIYLESTDLKNTGIIKDIVSIKDLMELAKTSGSYIYLDKYKTDIEHVYIMNRENYLKYIGQLLNNGEKIIRVIQTHEYIEVYMNDTLVNKTKRLINNGTESIISEINLSNIPSIDSYFN